MLDLGESIAVKVLGVLSTSVSVSVPVAVGLQDTELATPPASMTEPSLVPQMMAASLVPLMVTVTSCAVPSREVTLKVSVSVSPTLSACTAQSLSSSL